MERVGILQKLSGGDRRSIGRADEVVAEVLADLALLDEVFAGVFSLEGYLGDRSKIVKTFSMQALAGLALADERHYSHVKGLLADLIETDSPAMQSRGRKLLVKLAEDA